ncbi:Uncharacterized protein APZ42_011573 [Daphnia magna]|uniref:Uncharacterized protein n=1 Tax=Daphnia magna TaxID=35525 RepID=A0A162SSM2_9CRUS|nr:Uncharacterized protein APZ42_011573 [Daphnia magna]
MSEEEGAMWTGNSWKRRRRRDAMKDVRQLFGLTHAHQYLKSYNQMRRHLRLTIGYLIKKNTRFRPYRRSIIHLLQRCRIT